MSLVRNLVSSGIRFSNVICGLRNYSRMIVNRSSLPAVANPKSFLVQRVQPLAGEQHAKMSLLSSVTTLLPSLALRAPVMQQTRSVTKWSRVKGKRKTVKSVIKRFYRLEWGAWIRPMVGRHKRKWSKNRKRKIMSEKHVFCNATQSNLLDKMVTKYWRKRRHYVDDLYEPYHTRAEFPKTCFKPQ